MMNTHFFKTNTDTIAYYDTETNATNTLFFIHGFPFNKNMWLPQIEYFKTKFRCIAIDVKGHGESISEVENFTIDKFADDIMSLLQHLKIENVILVGLSMGGYISLNFLMRFPKFVKGLVISSTNCLSDAQEAQDKRMKTIVSLPKIGMAAYAKESVKNLFSAASLKNKSKQVTDIQKMIENTDMITVIKTLKALASRMETCSKLGKIAVPTLVLVGEKDTITPYSQAEMLWENIKNSELFMVESAGHIANLENTTAFNQIVEDFLTLKF